MVSLKQVMIVGMLVMLFAACSGDDGATDDASTTTVVGAPNTTLTGSTGGGGTTPTPTTVSTTTTTTVAPALSFPEYSIISREEAESGDIVVVLLDPTTYESLSDLDVLNVMSDLVEQYAPVFEAHIVETQAAADALFIEEPTEAEQTALDNYYIARLEEGFRIVYVGPLEGSDDTILSS